MTGLQLKNSILQLAIQGKLVPQDPNDEPASVLLEKIRKEKEQMVKDGKLKKKDLETTPISEDEKPFEIPKSWEWVRWGDVSYNIQYGYNAPALTSGDVRMVRISDIQNGEVQWATVPFCNISVKEKDTYLLGKNDILFARTGGTVGKSFLVKDIPYPSVYAGYLIRTQYDSSLLVPEYLKMFMESDLYWKQLRNGTIATAQPNCNGQTLSRMIIPLPPILEQQRIVAKIEELLPLVDEYDKAQKELDALNTSLPEALKKSILQEAIQGKLVPQDPNDEPASVLLEKIRKEKEQLVKDGKLKKKDLITTPISDDEKPFEIPESWEWCRLGNISTFNGGFAFKSHEYVAKGNGIRVLRISDFSEKGFIDKSPVYYPETDSCKNVLLEENDIVMCMTGGTVGKSYHVKKLFEPMYVNQRVADLKIKKQINCDYIYLNILAPYIQSVITENKNSTNDNISAELIKGFMIPLPPLAEQNRIVAKTEELFKAIDNLKVS